MLPLRSTQGQHDATFVDEPSANGEKSRPELFCFRCIPGNCSQRGHSIEEWPLLADLASSQ
jgi:hypothetical protein